MAKKPVITAKEAAAMIPNGATIMCGGFLACGQARAIVKELVALGTKDLTLIANDMGRAVGPKGEEFFGIAELIHNHQVKRVIATHVGMTPEVGQQNTEGTLEVNLLPQGTLAECVRAGGAGLGGVLTPVGIDTLVEGKYAPEIFATYLQQLQEGNRRAAAAFCLPCFSLLLPLLCLLLALL